MGEMRVESSASRRNLYRAGAALAALLIVVTGVFSYRSCVPGAHFEDGRAFAATLEPTSSDALGVAADTAFTLKLEQAVPLATVRSALTVEPAVEVAVRAADEEGKAFTITPRETLEADRVYRFVLALAGPEEAGYSWAYQVRGDLRVVGTIPGDRSTHVPLSTGIEIEFSYDGVKDPGSFFAIEPFVPGTWERHRRTLVYVPAVPLQPATVYTCTVKKGLGVEGSDRTLLDDFTFAFETAPQDIGPELGFYFWVDAEAAEFAAVDTPFFAVNYGRNDGSDTDLPPAVETRVFRYPDAATYIKTLVERDGVPWWAWASRDAYRPPTAGLVPVLEENLEPQDVRWQKYVVLPEGLPVGYYLVVFKLDPYVRYAWFQVTNLAAYSLVASDETALWFNDLASGSPVTSVTVRPATGGVSLGTSNPDGLARFPTPAGAAEDARPYERIPSYYAIARAPSGSEIVLDLSPLWSPFDPRSRLSDEYWTYLYCDRPLYLPSDVVRFWGVLQPRDASTPDIGQIEVELRSSYGVWGGRFHDWDDYSLERGSPILAQTVGVRRHTFTGDLALPNLRPGSYYLDVSYQDTVLVSQWFEVATYTKPAYRLQLTADKKAVFAGEKVRFDLQASFFEGTPVPQLRLDYGLFGSKSDLSGALTTDAAGTTGLTYTAPEGTEARSLERIDTLSLHADLPESGYISALRPVRVFEKNVALRATTSPGAAGLSVEARLNRVTLERINAAEGGPEDWDGEDYLGDPLAGRDIRGQLYEIRWEAHETGQYYDFIEKVSRKTYDYKEVRVPLESFTLTTDGNGVVTWAHAPEAAKSYVLDLTAVDDAGRAISSQLRFHGQGYTGPDQEYHWYHLVPADRDEARYDVGETAVVVARDGEVNLAPRSHAFLFYTGRRGLGAVDIQDSPEYGLTFGENLIPNTNVGGVYFDGRYYCVLGELQVGYKYDERRLDVTVTTDKEEYRPGERVVFTIDVKDKDSRPAVAEVNLSLVDEALFQLAGQSVELLDTLYRKSLGSYVCLSRVTHFRSLEGFGGAECGEGGEVRQDFRDNAMFECVTTGSNGRATADVTLPDNLTSWRLTYQAFAPGVRAGSGSVGVPVRLPFFVELSLNETYLTGDGPVVPARAYGTALASGDKVVFNAELGRVAADGSTGVVSKVETEGTAFRPVGLDLGSLAEGSYRLTVTGTSVRPDGTVLTDTLVKPILVYDSYLRLNRVDYYEVSQGLKVKAEPGEMATLTFCDRQRGQYLEMLWRLGGGGRRVDMKAASTVAIGLLKEHFALADEWLPKAPTASELLAFQRSSGGNGPEGGISLLPYSDSDLELSAKLAGLGGAGFDREGLRSYFGRIYEDAGITRERLCVALFGLAALGEPVLNEVRKLASELDLSPKEKLYACLALTELGDEETARDLFAGLLKTFGDRTGPLLRLNVSRDPEEIITATSLAAVVEAKLRLPDQDALLDYLIENRPWEELNFLEIAMFLQAALPAASAGETVSLTLQPDGTRIDLKPGETYTCYERSEDLPGLGFDNVRGPVGLCVAYRAPVDLASTKAGSGEASLSRTYWSGGTATRTFAPGSLVKVTIACHVAASAPEGPWQVVDFLPSNLKVVPRAYELGVSEDDVSYPVEVDGQKVTFNVYLEHTKDPKTGRILSREGDETITYYARVVCLGTCSTDPAVLQHVRSGEIFAATPEADVTVE